MRLNRSDWIFIATCVAITLASLVVITQYFGLAFPEASIDFRYDRAESRTVAAALLRDLELDTSGMKHAAAFESDDVARIFLERTLTLERANEVMGEDVLVWYWRHRWFRPLQEEEYAVEIAPTGEIVSYSRHIPEAAAMPATEEPAARRAAEAFLARAGVPSGTVQLVSASERRLPARVQRIFTWESRSIRPGGAPYWFVVTVDGGAASSYSRRLRVPEEWIRSYRELKSRNDAAGRIDLIFMFVVLIAALATFIARMRRGDLQLRFLLFIGVVTALLVAGVTLNSFPSALAGYDTTTSYPAFLARLVIITIIQSIGTAMLLIVICGAGEALYRESLPQHLAIPRLGTARALGSRRVFQSLILGYTLVGFFIAYQVAFYVIASKLGAWAPADLPYDDILNTALPWVAVLFAGFFPSFSEEFLSRAFSIPFFERMLRSRIFAIILAGFIWGFGHVGYPQQPWFIRGLEVGLAGVLLGFLMYRYGLLALLIWHYTVDAVYTALLLFRSGNTYYVVSAAMASLVFAFPLLASIALYVRNRGFVPDDDLTNAALPPPAEIPPPAEPLPSPLPAAVRPSALQLALAIGVAGIAAALIAARPSSPEDVVDYRIGSAQAEAIARAHLRSLGQALPAKVAAIPVSGFRSWEAGSPREEGGGPGGFDDVAATHMVRSGLSFPGLNAILRDEIHAATWMVRLFTPEAQTEYFVEVDPRTSRVIGYHKYADEAAPGERLERDRALVGARRAFARYGVDERRFDLREALSFPRPNRRDWLFHFDDRRPFVDAAHRRVSIRLMGAEVTQFATTIRVPESVYREAGRQTLGTILLLVLKIAGVVVGLALVIAGAIIVTRHGGVAWRQAGRVTAVLAIIPIALAAFRGDEILFRYSTITAWETFNLNVVTEAVRIAGVRILILFIAVAGMISVRGDIRRFLARDARALLGRAAVVAAITAVGLLAIFQELMRWIERAFPARTRVGEIAIPGSITLPFPSLFDFAEGLFGTIILCGAVTLFSAATAPWPRRAIASATTAILAFCVLVDTSAGPRELPLMLVGTAALAGLIWLIAHRILGSNPLAWPAAALLASLLQSAAALIHNERIDLLVHGLFLIAITFASIAWLALPARPDAA